MVLQDLLRSKIKKQVRCLQDGRVYICWDITLKMCFTCSASMPLMSCSISSCQLISCLSADAMAGSHELGVWLPESMACCHAGGILFQ